MLMMAMLRATVWTTSAQRSCSAVSALGQAMSRLMATVLDQAMPRLMATVLDQAIIRLNAVS